MVESGRRSRWGWLLWLVVALIAIAVTLLAAFPASWLAPRVNEASGGRLTLDDVDGSVWSGSAALVVGQSDTGNAPITLPGRLSWTLGAWALLTGRIDAHVIDDALLSRALVIGGTSENLEIGAAEVRLPDGLLARLGPPFSTLGIDGDVAASWQPLLVTRGLLFGNVELTLNNARSSLTRISPLGSYRMDFDMQGPDGTCVLKSDRGPLLLSGNGRWSGRALRFDGQASATPEYREQLADLLSILGKPQGDSYLLHFGTP